MADPGAGPRIDRARGWRAVPALRAAEARTEALRVLRSNLLVAVGDLDHPVVLVTSANPAEGKTATCAGLAQSFALGVTLNKLDAREVRLGYGGAGGAIADLDGGGSNSVPWARDWADPAG